MDFLDRAAEVGAEAIQVCDNLHPLELTTSSLTRIRRRAESANIRVELGITAGNKEEIKHGLEAARAVGARVLRIVPALPSVEGMFELFSSIEPVGVDSLVIAVENHFRFHPKTIAELMRKLDPHRFAVCLDPVNSIAALAGPEEAVRYLAPMAVTFHYKDVQVFRDRVGLRISGCSAGEGQIDPLYLIGQAYAGGRLESVHLESWLDRDGAAEDTAALEAEYIRNGVRLLRRVRDSLCRRTD